MEEQVKKLQKTNRESRKKLTQCEKELKIYKENNATQDELVLEFRRLKDIAAKLKTTEAKHKQAEVLKEQVKKLQRTNRDLKNKLTQCENELETIKDNDATNDKLVLCQIDKSAAKILKDTAAKLKTTTAKLKTTTAKLKQAEAKLNCKVGRPGSDRNLKIGDFLPDFPKLELTRLSSMVFDAKLDKMVKIPAQAKCHVCNKIIRRLSDKASHPCARTFTCNGVESACKKLKTPSLHIMKMHLVVNHSKKHHLNKKEILKFFKTKTFEKLRLAMITEQANLDFFVHDN